MYLGFEFGMLPAVGPYPYENLGIPEEARADTQAPARTHTQREEEGDGNVFPKSDPNSRFLFFFEIFLQP
jgi:hypothetical protein